MPYCCVKICRNKGMSRNNSKGVTFHGFPKSYGLWKSDWVEIIRQCNGEKDWIPTRTSVLCSNHFKEKDFCNPEDGTNRRLRSYARPRQFLYENPPDMPSVQDVPRANENNNKDNSLHIKKESLEEELRTYSLLQKSSEVSTQERNYVQLSRSGILIIEIPPNDQEPSGNDTESTSTSSESPPVVQPLFNESQSPESPIFLQLFTSQTTTLINQPSITCIVPYNKAFKRQEIMCNKQKKRISSLNQKIYRLLDKNEELRNKLISLTN